LTAQLHTSTTVASEDRVVNTPGGRVLRQRLDDVEYVLRHCRYEEPAGWRRERRDGRQLSIRPLMVPSWKEKVPQNRSAARPPFVSHLKLPTLPHAAQLPLSVCPWPVYALRTLRLCHALLIWGRCAWGNELTLGALVSFI
jgi:hypothetical protein